MSSIFPSMPMVRVSTRLEFPRRSNSRLINIAFQSPHRTSVCPVYVTNSCRCPRWLRATREPAVRAPRSKSCLRRMTKPKIERASNEFAFNGRCCQRCRGECLALGRSGYALLPDPRVLFGALRGCRPSVASQRPQGFEIMRLERQKGLLLVLHVHQMWPEGIQPDRRHRMRP